MASGIASVQIFGQMAAHVHLVKHDEPHKSAGGDIRITTQHHSSLQLLANAAIANCRRPSIASEFRLVLRTGHVSVRARANRLSKVVAVRLVGILERDELACNHKTSEARLAIMWA